VVTIARELPAWEAMKAALRELRLDLGRHAVIAVIAFAVSIAISSALSMAPLPFRILQQHNPMAFIVGAPVQLATSVLNQLCSAAVTCWLLAGFVTLTEDRSPYA
jgi:hypothetical protein